MEMDVAANGRTKPLLVALLVLAASTATALAFFPNRFDVVVFTAVVWTGFFSVLSRSGYLPLAITAAGLFWLLIAADRLTFGSRPQHVGAYAGLLIGTFALVVVLRQLLGESRRLLIVPATLLVSTLLFGTAALFIAHRVRFGVPLTAAEFYAIYQTDRSEALEFLAEFGDARYLAVPLAAILILGLLALAQHAARVRPVNRVALFALVAASLALTVQFRSGFGVFRLVFSSALSYRHELAAFRELRDNRAHGQVPVVASKDGRTETYVFVIGESLNRRHMRLYGYHRNTTPRLDSIHRAGELLKFEHAYSTHTQTMRVLPTALTAASQFNGRTYLDSPSLLDIAKAAGFESHWITNQVLYGPWDNLVSILAQDADELVSLNKSVGATTVTSQQDGAVVPALEEVLATPSDRNRLIFVHLMGSHPRFCNRFPETFAFFTEPLSRGAYGRAVDADPDRVTSWVNCYDNSVLYNDHVVAELLRVVQRVDGVGGFVYFADHGQDVLGGNLHYASRFRYGMVEIPMLAWFSDGYRARYPDNYATLRRNVEAIFPTDLFYDTALGVMDIRTRDYEPIADLSNESYEAGEFEVRLVNGEHSLRGSGNVRLHQRQNIKQLAAAGELSRVVPHRVNSTGKLSEVLYDGYRALEVDVLFRGGAEGHFEIGHDEQHASQNDLAAFLALMPRDSIEKLWLDVKNLNAANAEDVETTLLRLDEEYDLKSRVVFESPAVDQLRAIGRSGFHTTYYLPTQHLLELTRAGVADRLRAEAEAIARRVAWAEVSAVSFDAALFGFVKEYLEPRLAAHIVYHTWDLGLSLSDPDFRQKLEAAEPARDPRVRTILVRFESRFSL